MTQTICSAAEYNCSEQCYTIEHFGCVAQLGQQLPCKQSFLRVRFSPHPLRKKFLQFEELVVR